MLTVKLIPRCRQYLRTMSEKSKYFSSVSPRKTRSKQCADQTNVGQEKKLFKKDGESYAAKITPRPAVPAQAENFSPRRKLKIEYEAMPECTQTSSRENHGFLTGLPVKEESQTSSDQALFDSSMAIKIENIEPGQPGWEPLYWRDVLENIREMRSARDAPVDNMGAEKCSDKESNPKVYRFHVLISLMLSSQTRDQVTHAAMTKLRAHGLTVQSILNTSDDLLGQLIYPVGFWKRKVTYIKKTCMILKEKYDCDIPPTLEELCKLPGVGPKMAHLCMDIGWGKLTGIGVDTHVHRISNRLGWTGHPTKNPEETRKALEGWMPQDIWSETNLLMVGFGQQICLPVGPQCNQCLNVLLCPFGMVPENRGLQRKRSPSKSPKKSATPKKLAIKSE